MTTKRFLLCCGVIAPVFFTVTYLIEGATRSGYEPMRNAVSELSIGDLGWIQVVNFLITGTLVVAFAVGLRLARRGWALPAFIAIIGLGLIGAGLFRSDPIGAGVSTTAGTLHNLFSLGVFLGLPIACFIAAYRFARAKRIGWLIYSLVTAIVFFVFFALASVGFSGAEGFAAIGGLMQRLSLVVGFAWIGALAFMELRATQTP